MHLVDKLFDCLPFPSFRDPRHVHVEVHLVDDRLTGNTSKMVWASRMVSYGIRSLPSRGAEWESNRRATGFGRGIYLEEPPTSCTPHLRQIDRRIGLSHTVTDGNQLFRLCTQYTKAYFRTIHVLSIST